VKTAYTPADLVALAQGAHPCKPFQLDSSSRSGEQRVGVAPRMLADVLWEAANNFLWDGFGLEPKAYEHERNQYSCDAVHQCFELPRDRVAVKRHLAEMGCNTNTSSGFNSLTAGEQRQGVRYMWLLLAMHVAEDEGIEVSA
jgi:hypothetical protein